MEWFKVLGPTITTGTSEIDLGGSGVRLESPCNGSILAMKIEMARAGAPTTVEADMVVVRLKSNTIPVVPYEAFAQPVNAGVGAEIQTHKEEAFWIPINAPVKVGDKLQITAAEQQACTVHPYVGVTIIFADYSSMPLYHSVIGTLTTAGAAATEYKMTTGFDIVGARWIKAIYACMFEVTEATSKGCIYWFRLSSSVFGHAGLTGMGDIQFIGNFIPSYLSAATASAGFQRLTKMELYDYDGIPIGTPAHIDAYMSATVAFNAAAFYNLQIVYIQ